LAADEKDASAPNSLEHDCCSYHQHASAGFERATVERHVHKPSEHVVLEFGGTLQKNYSD
jgi:hypothetical protein